MESENIDLHNKNRITINYYGNRLTSTGTRGIRRAMPCKYTLFW